MGGSRSPSVLLLGAGITVLGALRALAQNGIAAQSAEQPLGIERWSRWFNSASIETLNIEQILDWCRQFPEKPIVVPCSDSWVQKLADARDSLSGVARIGVCRPDVVARFIDKSLFATLVKNSGVPAPRVFEGAADLPSEIQFNEGRWFLKPRHSQQFFGDYGVKAWWPKENAEAVRLQLEAARRGHTMVVQEYIAGPATSHAYVEGYRRTDDTYDGLFARRRTRMYPSEFGNSTSMESVPLGEVQGAVESLQSLLAHAQYHGVFSAEFKRDERDGIWKIIEVNIRPWWYVEFAARCGVNVMAALVYDLIGAPPTNITPYQSGLKMVNMYTDWAQLRSTPHYTVHSLYSRALEWGRSSCTVFSWSDPLPGILWSGQTIMSALARRMS